MKCPHIALSDGHVFRWTLQGDRTPEVYGWIEKDWSILPGSGGWWRTTDAQRAARIAASNHGLSVIDAATS